MIFDIFLQLSRTTKMCSFFFIKCPQHLRMGSSFSFLVRLKHAHNHSPMEQYQTHVLTRIWVWRRQANKNVHWLKKCSWLFHEFFKNLEKSHFWNALIFPACSTRLQCNNFFNHHFLLRWHTKPAVHIKGKIIINNINPFDQSNEPIKSC